MKILAATVSAILLLPAIGAAEVLRQEVVDRVWAGHPVQFAFLAHGDRLVVAYYDAERRMTVASRGVDGGAWERFQPPGKWLPARDRQSTVTGWDTHNYLALAVDDTGHLHLSGNMHVDPLIYYRSKVPLDAKSLERIDRMTGERESECTYPLFFRGPQGEFLFRYRDGWSGNGADIYNVYDAATKEWRRLVETPILDGQGERNAYALLPVAGPDGRFHLAWMWRENVPDVRVNNNVSYARSRDLVSWENGRGESLALPIVRATGDVVDPSGPDSGLFNNGYALGFDSIQRPIVAYHRYDAVGNSQIFCSRFEGESWVVRQISRWDFRWEFGGAGAIGMAVSVASPFVDGQGRLVLPYFTKQKGDGRWVLDEENLRIVEELPPVPAPLPLELMKAETDFPGMSVKTLTAGLDTRRWVLRWEAPPANRDLPREKFPEPVELRLYELSSRADEAAR